MAGIETGHRTLSREPVQVGESAYEALDLVRALAEAQGIELHAEFETCERRYVLADRQRLQQVLLNLLSNAIKFGRGQPIEVDLSLGAADHIEVAVTDHGEGIEPDDLPRIFDEFVQLSNSQQLGGTGLGLPISKRLATLLGGELRVTSERGKGSTFRLTLPERIGMED